MAVIDTETKDKTVTRDYDLLDDLKKNARTTYKVNKGEVISEKETKKEWSYIVTSIGACGWIPSKYIKQ